jgi:predicted secreted protein
VLATLPGSLIAHYAIPEGEEPRRIVGHVEYPSIYGARAVTRLLASAGDEEVLREAVKPLGKRAVRTLVSALDDSAQHDVTINWLTHEGEYTAVGPRRAARGIDALSIVPEMIRRPSVRVLGRLNKPDYEKRVVRLQPPRGRAMVLHYPRRLEPVIGESWRKWIVGFMAVEEPENPSLPKAPRRRRTITRIEEVYDDLHDIPEWLLSD